MKQHLYSGKSYIIFEHYSKLLTLVEYPAVTNNMLKNNNLCNAFLNSTGGLGGERIKIYKIGV